MFEGKLNLRRQEGGSSPKIIEPTDTTATAKKIEKSTKLPAAGNVLRDRGKQRKKSDIAKLYDEQASGVHADFSDVLGAGKDFSEHITRVSSSFSAGATRARKAASALKDRVHRPDQYKNTYTAKNSTATTAHPKTSMPNWMQRKKIAIAFGVLVALFGTGAVLHALLTTNDQKNDVQGTSVSESADTDTANQASNESRALPVVTERELAFDLLFSPLKSAGSTDIVLLSPPENDPVYAYNDEYEGAILKISQQQLPDAVRDDPVEGLKSIAESFNATDTIRINRDIIYHGYTERNGGVQSIIFVKDELLVFIASSQRLSDDAWAVYISTLTK